MLITMNYILFKNVQWSQHSVSSFHIIRRPLNYRCRWLWKVNLIVVVVKTLLISDIESKIQLLTLFYTHNCLLLILWWRLGKRLGINNFTIYFLKFAEMTFNPYPTCTKGSGHPLMDQSLSHKKTNECGKGF